MLGELITRGLLMVLGYAYPAFECFKTVEKNKVHIEELRFWCQYWIIVALLTILERIGDAFVSWVPMYGEMKLALFIYLWYPKTKGTGFIYETFLRPYVAKHETDIERNLLDLRARAWDLAIYYWQNCTQLGQSAFFDLLNYLGSQSSKLKNQSSKSKKDDKEKDKDKGKGSPLPPPNTPFSFMYGRQPSDKRRPDSWRLETQPPNPETVQVHFNSQTHFVHTGDTSIPESPTRHGSTDASHGQDQRSSKFRFRRSK
ncbi:unnamed protein product [Ilex paraguariensis]|uniref:HVA22-like protein n=1 Tax=Ilex paraguariensis TaxID=185542 RepID=A0ABC8UID9_9AQUA